MQTTGHTRKSLLELIMKDLFWCTQTRSYTLMCTIWRACAELKQRDLSLNRGVYRLTLARRHSERRFVYLLRKPEYSTCRANDKAG